MLGDVSTDIAKGTFFNGAGKSLKIGIWWRRMEGPELKKLTKRIVQFQEERDWKQFHNPKDVALSLTLEAVEVLEHFQWKNGKEIQEYLETNKTELADELMDVLYWVFTMCNDLKIDIPEAFERKMQKNEAKYPVHKAKGKKEKYNRL